MPTPLRLLLAGALLALSAGSAAAQQRPELRPFATLLIDVPLLFPEKLEATFVRLDTATLHVVTELSAGDTLAVPLGMVRRAYLRRDSTASPEGVRRGTLRGAVVGAAAGTVVGSALVSVRDRDLWIGGWETAVTALLGAFFGAEVGRQDAADPGWTRIDLRRYRPLRFPLDIPRPPAGDPAPAGA